MKIVTHCVSPPVRQLFKNQTTLGIILAVYLFLLMLSFVCLGKDANPDGKDTLHLKYFQLIPLSPFLQSLSLNMKLLLFVRIYTLIGTFNEKKLKKNLTRCFILHDQVGF